MLEALEAGCRVHPGWRPSGLVCQIQARCVWSWQHMHEIMGVDLGLSCLTCRGGMRQGCWWLRHAAASVLGCRGTPRAGRFLYAGPCWQTPAS